MKIYFVLEQSLRSRASAVAAVFCICPLAVGVKLSMVTPNHSETDFNLFAGKFEKH